MGRGIAPACLLGPGYSPPQRDQGQAHQAAVRTRACTGIRLLYRCWQERTPDEEATSLQTLTRRGASLIHTLAQAS